MMRIPLRRISSMKEVGNESNHVNYWLIAGEVNKLEGLILQGEGHLLDGKTGQNIRTREFIRALPEYKRNVKRMLIAVYNGDIETVTELITFKKCIQARHPFTMCSTLSLAVIHNHPEVLAILLSHKLASINDKDLEGKTALHYACAKISEDETNTRMYDMLIEHSANTNLLDSEGYAAESYRKIPGLLDMKQIQGLNRYPISNGDDIDRLISDRNLRQLQEMVLKGEWHRIEHRIFPPGSRDLIRNLKQLYMRGEAIHQAILDDDLQTFKQLVDSYDMAIFQSSTGHTPLHLSIILNRIQFIEYLLMIYPKCVDVMDKEKKPSMYYAKNFHTDESIKRKLETMLIAGGAMPIENLYVSPRSAIVERKMISAQLSRRSNSFSEEIIQDDEEKISPEIEQRILSINFNKRQYRVLENINFEGKSDQIWMTVKKHLNNNELTKYINNYRHVQNQLNNAIQAIKDNDIRKIRSMANEELIQAR